MYMYIVENCPVYNSNVAINVPFLITDYTFSNVWLLNIVYIKAKIKETVVIKGLL